MQSALDWFTGAPLNITIIISLAISISLLGQRSISRFMNRIANADLIPGPKRSGAPLRFGPGIKSAFAIRFINLEIDR